jgi:HSP20 family protein
VSEQQTQIATRGNGGAGSAESRQMSQQRRWNPFVLLDELQDELARFWGRSSGGRSMSPSRLLAQLPFGAPRLDMYEQNGYVVVKADLPGVRKEDLRVELEDGDLIIQGESRSEQEVKEDQYYRMERSFGRFYRRIPLGFDVNPEDIQATLIDGVLEVRIPKPPETQPNARRIPVK